MTEIQNLNKLHTDELAKIPLKELLELQEKLQKAIDIRRENDKREIYQKITALASESGFTLDELILHKPSKKSAPAVKYRNPDNSKQVWSGSGRKPKWLTDLLDAGKKLEDFAV